MEPSTPTPSPKKSFFDRETVKPKPKQAEAKQVASKKSTPTQESHRATSYGPPEIHPLQKLIADTLHPRNFSIQLIPGHKNTKQFLNPRPKDYTTRRYPILLDNDRIKIPERDKIIQSFFKPGKIFSDNEIQQIHLPLTTGHFEEKIPFAKNEGNKHIIQQQGRKPNNALIACTAMLMADADKTINHQAIVYGKHYTVEDSVIDVSYSGIGLKEIDTPYTNVNDLLEKIRLQIIDLGPAIVMVEKNDGDHFIIIDHLSEDLRFTRIRDPFHGWDITVHADSLFKKNYESSLDFTTLTQPKITTIHITKDPRIQRTTTELSDAWSEASDIESSSFFG